MHKPTQSRVKSRPESASTPSMRFFREIHTRDHSRIRFSHSNGKVPATYFPLLRSEPTKSSRKTALCFGQMESTFLSKKTKQWKVQTSQKTRRNSPLGHACLESVPSHHRDQVTRFCGGNCPDCILSFTLHDSKFTNYLMPTTCGDIQQKNRHPIFSGVETSMKMTFHSFEQNRSQVRERRVPLSIPPLLFFH
jgi:hypothetical protein